MRRWARRPQSQPRHHSNKSNKQPPAAAATTGSSTTRAAHLHHEGDGLVGEAARELWISAEDRRRLLVAGDAVAQRKRRAPAEHVVRERAGGPRVELLLLC